MSFFHSPVRALSAVILLITLGSAQQQCYYPDGSLSTDTPCGSAGDSSCCGSDSWCMDNGLCFGGGLVSRGSCTDKTWASNACTGFCRNVSRSSQSAVTPCSVDGSFACGLNSTSCDDDSLLFATSGAGGIVLRDSQVQALIAPAGYASAGSADAPALYTSSQMAGLGCGLGLPLLVVSCALVFYLYRRPNPSPISPTSDPRGDMRLRPPPHLHMHPALRATDSRDGSEAGSSIYSMQIVHGTPRYSSGAIHERHKAGDEKILPERTREIRVELDASSESQRKSAAAARS